MVHGYHTSIIGNTFLLHLHFILDAYKIRERVCAIHFLKCSHQNQNNMVLSWIAVSSKQIKSALKWIILHVTIQTINYKLKHPKRPRKMFMFEWNRRSTFDKVRAHSVCSKRTRCELIIVGRIVHFETLYRVCIYVYIHFAAMITGLCFIFWTSKKCQSEWNFHVTMYSIYIIPNYYRNEH